MSASIQRIPHAQSATCAACGGNARGHGLEPPTYSAYLPYGPPPRRIDLCNRCAVEIAQRIMQDLAESKL